LTVYLIDPQTDGDPADLFTDMPDLIAITPDALGALANEHVIIADVNLYLDYQWSQPTIVLAHSHQGDALVQAWQRGAWAGWIRERLPNSIAPIIQQLMIQHQHQSDSRDLPAAARLQKRLLPKLFDLPHYQIEHYYQPASALSGDWLDYWLTPDNQLLFYLADVAGHGAASSLLTGWLAAFHGAEQTPQALLARMNRLLVTQNVGKHITVLCGLLDPYTHHLEWCSAGHYPPPILITPAGTQTLHSSSFPLGLVPELALTTQTLTLPKHSRLLFCSDGAIEAFSGGTSEQLAQLVQALEQQTFHPPSHLPDDLTILSLSYR